MKHWLTCVVLMAATAWGASILGEPVTTELAPGGAYNVVTLGAPREVALSDLGLKEAGIAAGKMFLQADEIRIFTSRASMDANESPKARIWVNAAEGALWYHTGGTGSAEGHVIRVGEVVLVHTRASRAPVAWTNPLAISD